MEKSWYVYDTVKMYIRYLIICRDDIQVKYQN